MRIEITNKGNIRRFPGHKTVDFNVFMKKYNVIPLSEYKGYNEYVTYECKRCSRPTKNKFSSLRMSKNKLFLCFECRKIWLRELAVKNGQSVSHEKVVSHFEKYNCKLLDNYINNVTKMRFICRCGREGITNWLCLGNGRKEPKCGECKKEHHYYKPGDKHPNWNSELDDKDRLGGRRKKGDTLWKKYILSVGKCFITGDKIGPFSAHHLLSYRKFPDKRTDRKNGVCILRDLHKKFHSVYGYTKFTPKNFFEFVKKERKLLNLNEDNLEVGLEELGIYVKPDDKIDRVSFLDNFFNSELGFME